MKRIEFSWMLMSLFLSLFAVSLANAVDMGEILSAETRMGSLTNLGQTDTFTFNGAKDQRIIIHMSREIGSLVDPYIELYDPDGVLEAYYYCGLACTHTELNWGLLNSGRYTILVKDNGGNGTGDYSLSLLQIPGPTVSPPDPNGGTILSGETKLGEINPHADTDAYTFNGLVSQTVKITMSRLSGSLVDPYIELYDSNGVLEASFHCGLACTYTELNWQLLQSALYTIVVKDNGGNGSGGYALSFTKIPAPQPSPALLVSLNQEVFYTNDTFIFSAHVVNGPNAVTVEVKTWVMLPDGSGIPILDSHQIYTLEPNANFTVEIFRYQFNGSEPTGNYLAGGRFIDPLTGRELSASIETFSFSP